MHRLKQMALDESSSSDSEGSEKGIPQSMSQGTKATTAQKVKEEVKNIKEPSIPQSNMGKRKEDLEESKSQNRELELSDQPDIIKQFGDTGSDNESFKYSSGDEEIKHEEAKSSMIDMSMQSVESGLGSEDWPESAIDKIDGKTSMTYHVKSSSSNSYQLYDLSDSIIEIDAKFGNKSVSELKPRDYQQSIIRKISESTDPYGRIVSLETGLGKTLIAVHIILFKTNIATKSIDTDLSLRKRNKSLYNTKIFFLVPTKNLVEQQAEYLSKNKILKKSGFQICSLKSSKDFDKSEAYIYDEKMPVIVVMIHKVALTLFRTGMVAIEDIDVMVFDECHHARTEHPYNLIMREFYFYGLNYEDPEEIRYENRPYILGLTASPIKTKIKNSSQLSFKYEMMDEIKELCSNLNSKIVSTELKNIDDQFLTNHSNKFITYTMKDYWKSLEFLNDPFAYIP